MGDLGFCRLPTSLNPTAEEFRPSSDDPNRPPHHLYFTYTYDLPPPPLLPLPPPSTAAILHPSLPPPSPVPTRALILSSVASDVSESTVRRNLEVFGDVRSVQMERIRDGVVTVHFYDLRQAAEAVKAVQEQHMQQQFRLRRHFDGLLLSSLPADGVPPPLPAAEARGLIAGRAVWAQFAFPVVAGVPDGYNQGTVVVSNLDSDVSAGKLKEIFEAFGCVKEIRDIPLKKEPKICRVLRHTEGRRSRQRPRINGKPVTVEFHRGGGGGGYNQTRYHHVNSGVVPVSHVNFSRKFDRPAVVSYRPQPPPSPPGYRKDRVVDYDGIGGDNVNGRGFFRQHRQPSVERWGGGDGGGGGCDGGRSKSFKGSRYTREKTDPRFLITDDGVISSFHDTRTTVMIKNIPNKYSQKLLLNMLDNHLHSLQRADGGRRRRSTPSSYDFVYLPIDFVNKCNVGYGFVNMTSPAAARRLYAAFHHRNWEVFNSKKICEVSYARLQGLEALKEHFKNSKFPREAEEYMPVVFTPPRDGLRNLTEPIPIIGRSTTTTATATSTTTISSPPPPSPSSSTSLSEEEVGVDDDMTDDGGDDVTAAATTRSGGDGCD
ncbi:LOW QUALITY PROTEIN: hypothetical protein OSB04_009083 [Centaurea solstitialis]|uniref:RRM domain-containing protein n=1 Tax=Centaurea solstitialis TaxID=347529 RepID=A0AA38TN10_9ASTR|nr:LOW QUALITY PROTEIN: hypothetical protein OSB04_009083 [Centaurea solstitialis]